MAPPPNIKTAPEEFCKKKLFYWPLQGNGWRQLLLVVLVILVVFARIIPLEMQKRIINESLALRQFGNLFLYCGIYLSAIISAGAIKFSINSLQTLIGEQAMSRMRTTLYSHILTLPLSFFRRTQPGFVVSSLITELSTIGTFAGMAVAVPLTNLLTLFAVSGYLIWLNLKLALATLAIYPIVIFVLPILQKKVNDLNKQRVDISRQTSSVIAESISGITEIHAHGSFSEENKKFEGLIGHLQKVRTRWTLLRHSIKTTNNFFISLGPFIVFILGGYLTIKGELHLGALVAFLSAQEKLYDPWKELIAFYQLFQDALIRYRKTTEYFDVASEINFKANCSNLPEIAGKLEVAKLFLWTEDGHQLLNNISFSLEKGEHLALVGFSGSGKSTLAKCLGNIQSYQQGSIRLDGVELRDLSKAYVVDNIGFIPQHPFIFTGTVEDNLLYAHNARYAEQTRPILSLDEKIEALQNAAFFVDVLRFGLDTRISADDHEFKQKVLRMRESFLAHYSHELADLISFYDTEEKDVAGNRPDQTVKPGEYLDDQPIINNIFYGKILSTRLEDQERINQAVVQLLIEEDCLEAVAQFGLHYNVGSEGIKLSGGQRQKLAIARVILKRPRFFIMDEATSALDNASQSRIERLRANKWQGRKTVISVVHRLDTIEGYNKIAVMRGGRMVEFGTYAELMQKKGFLYRLASENRNGQAS